MESKIILYTSQYPFSKSYEAFLEPEIPYIINYFTTSVIVPIKGDSVKRDVPDGVIVDESLIQRSLWFKIRAILGCFSKRVVRAGLGANGPVSISEFLDCIKYYYAANLVYFDLLHRLRNEVEPIVLYSYWLTYPPIAFVWCKERYPDKNMKLVSRAHGSDIYSTDVGVYIPGRELVIKGLDAIYTVSDFGSKYLKNRYFDSRNISVSRLGVKDNHPSSQMLSGGCINIVSCSNLIPLKRVSLLFHCLDMFAASHPSLQLSWIHIGQGYLKESLEKEIVHHRKNLEISLAGAMNNSDILRLYRTQYFDAYILLSESEGIPVSIMEAISSGIPVIATDVGGVSEIVNPETGVLLPSIFSQDEFDGALSLIIGDEHLREKAYKFFLNNYSAESNFQKFYSDIAQL